MKPRGRREQSTGDAVRGVTLDVSGVDLLKVVAERIRWHREHAASAEAELKQLLEVPADPACAGRGIGDWRRDARLTELRNRFSDHEARGRFLGFVRQHLSSGRTYTLAGSDLRMLDIMPGTIHW